MNWPTLADSAKPFLVAAVGGCTPLLLWLLTRRSAQADQVKASALQAQQLYVGGAKDLLATLQEELRARNGRIGALEAEREQLRTALAEERQCFEQVRHRHRELVAFLATAQIKVPDELHG